MVIAMIPIAQIRTPSWPALDHALGRSSHNPTGGRLRPFRDTEADDLTVEGSGFHAPPLHSFGCLIQLHMRHLSATVLCEHEQGDRV